MKKFKSKQNKSRESLADPFQNVSYYERLKMANSINLENNHTIEELGDGYIKIQPIDKNKILCN